MDFPGNEAQVQGFEIPSTPPRQVPPNPQAIYKGLQENHLNQTHEFNSVNFFPVPVQVNETRTLERFACFNFSDGAAAEKARTSSGSATARWSKGHLGSSNSGHGMVNNVPNQASDPNNGTEESSNLGQLFEVHVQSAEFSPWSDANFMPQLQPSVSAALQENEVTRTPQQKPRRKKFVPKVVKEHPKTPKPPKPQPKPSPSPSKDATKPKRKYVRRKGLTTTPTEAILEDTNPKLEPTKKPCRRVLNFDTQLQEANLGAYLDQNTSYHHEEQLSISSSCIGTEHEDQVCYFTQQNIMQSVLSSNDSNCSTDVVLVKGETDKLKGNYSQGAERGGGNMNSTIGLQNTMQACAMGNMQCAHNPKKKRTEEAHDSTASGSSSSIAGINIFVELPIRNSKNESKADYGPQFEGSELGQVSRCFPAEMYHTQKFLNVDQHSKRISEYQNQISDLVNFNPPGDSPNWHHIVEDLHRLNINREISPNDVTVSHNLKYQDHNALVIYKKDGTMVPYEGPFSPIKKRRPRPKVILDEETNRVWKLLLEDIDSQGVNGSDEEKRKWWEEERRVFHGRANSFISRMSLVQGDRRFSQWKGSVVDSVVGVFLTQNVSDHLSSSAFMSLAAHFPANWDSNQNACSEEGTSMVLDEQEVCIVKDTREGNGSALNQSTIIQMHVTVCDSKYEDNGVVDSSGSTKCIISNVSPTNESNSRSVNYSEGSPGTSGISTLSTSTAPTKGIGTQIFMRDMKEDHGTATSRNSTHNLMAQYTRRIGPCPKTNLKLEDAIKRFTLLHEVQSEDDAKSFPKDDASNALKQFQGIANNIQRHQASNFIHSDRASGVPMFPFSNCHLDLTSDTELQEAQSLEMAREGGYCYESKHVESFKVVESSLLRNRDTMQLHQQLSNFSCISVDVTESSSAFDDSGSREQKTMKSNSNKHDFMLSPATNDNVSGTSKPKRNDANGNISDTSKPKRKRDAKMMKEDFDWDSLRREVDASRNRTHRTLNTMDSVDWEAVRCADVNVIAEIIKDRGMNNVLAKRIKNFLDRLVRDHGSIDLEWLRDIPPDKAKEYLLSINGLGIKSVECVRLLTLHHLAFPVDTNVGRIAVRLGWVPLQPLPESLQLHLLELYPVLESIQKYLWPRLCKLDQRMLYELHYHMITFGKVFCTKSKPNCNACPMRGECRHFASAFASSRLSLPGPDCRSIVTAAEVGKTHQTATMTGNEIPLPIPLSLEQVKDNKQTEKISQININEPIIEVPASPEPECRQTLETDIEDALCEDPDEIPTIKLNIQEFTQNLKNYIQDNMELQDGEMSRALVALTPEATLIPTPKLKSVTRLRTEHQVYELPDSHPLLMEMEKREPDDPCFYLLAIWTPGETVESIQPPERRCTSQGLDMLCDDHTCFACNSMREANSQTVRGTLLIPCRTAMRGNFPLNGTYFQVNEVFADHESSHDPINVPRAWLWNLPRRTVYFGTSIPAIFRGFSTENIQQCFWRGYVCVRGFDQKSRAPRPLIPRFHYPASKLTNAKGKTNDKVASSRSNSRSGS